jgi:predicted N-acyltransferase
MHHYCAREANLKYLHDIIAEIMQHEQESSYFTHRMFEKQAKRMIDQMVVVTVKTYEILIATWVNQSIRLSFRII